MPVRDDETEIAGARVIDARVVDLVEDAVAQREPDATVATDGSADAAFRARRPACGEPGPARGERLNCSARARDLSTSVASVVRRAITDQSGQERQR